MLKPFDFTQGKLVQHDKSHVKKRKLLLIAGIRNPLSPDGQVGQTEPPYMVGIWKDFQILTRHRYPDLDRLLVT